MNCEELRDVIDAQMDNELDVLSSLQFERHLAECSKCRGIYDQFRQMHDSVRSQMPYFKAPDEFVEKIRAGLHSSRTREKAARKWLPQPIWSVAAGLTLALFIATFVFQVATRPSTTALLADAVASDHIRSLIGNHLTDIASSDQHTVKPWFSGKLNFAPKVIDLPADGFPLTGGRLDYLDGRTVAALVYKRGRHIINLFIWPSGDSDSTLHKLTVRGYNVVHWNRSHMTYWAISDVNPSDLDEFARDLASQ